MLRCSASYAPPAPALALRPAATKPQSFSAPKPTEELDEFDDTPIMHAAASGEGGTSLEDDEAARIAAFMSNTVSDWDR